MRRIRVVEFSRVESELCAAMPAPKNAIVRDFTRSALLTGTNPRPLVSRELRRTWRTFAARSFVNGPSEGSAEVNRQSTSPRRPAMAADLRRESAMPFEVIALSLFCAAIGPAVAILLFVLVNNNWGRI
jgi:hypothetical protein